MIRTTAACALTFVLLSGQATACSPSPSCWQRWNTSHPTTLKASCRGHARNGDTVRQIADRLNDREKAALFADVCRKFGIVLRD